MKHILFICLLFFCIACEENKSVDPTLMPEATATGANTFGCLVDGWGICKWPAGGYRLLNLPSWKIVPV